METVLHERLSQRTESSPPQTTGLRWRCWRDGRCFVAVGSSDRMVGRGVLSPLPAPPAGDAVHRPPSAPYLTISPPSTPSVHRPTSTPYLTISPPSCVHSSPPWGAVFPMSMVHRLPLRQPLSEAGHRPLAEVGVPQFAVRHTSSTTGRCSPSLAAPLPL